MINLRRNPLLGVALFIAIILTLFLLTKNASIDENTTEGTKVNEKVIIGNKEELKFGESKVKACFLILIRNKELKDFKRTMLQLEDRFNKRYNYPYVFLNDVEFTDDFKQQIQALTNSTVEFGSISKNHWSIPSFVNRTLVNEKMNQMREDKVMYGDNESYHHMCRFESGFFFRHELTKKYEYYWRVEPEVEFSCDIDFDPFAYMKDNNKLYGFTISMYEYENTIPTLWKTVNSWIKDKNINLPATNAMKFLSDDNGSTYNLCHFWTNFEIAAFSLWRDPKYIGYFEYLDKTGGFFYERWGDAPVHSIYAALTLDKNQIHFFNEIGYFHSPYIHCPKQDKFRKLCHCSPDDSFDLDGYSCSKKWFDLNQLTFDD